ncbi:tRNA (adenine22-N1)-methyltransferase [Streptohalobacillus salinus]|uniref:tRNA (Adenine22-N1)-methyltransferase n=1 Tax=Streptohalobacillus salinus TaxID=621096 RepID=A0A2V3WB01_9BACI|nr:tRNA (adenine(22)-N(1))-methyltransferase TrmK [Streptohalobacillus salinus]PXW91637.1 tRNA (adenine22-N1)-methyltransferase [Streptohalobacillus salinus]
MEAVKLSHRLKTAANYIQSGAFFADIGSDHAYLPIYVCQIDQTARAIAGELNEGPKQAAQSHVSGYQLTDRIDVRKGDGLSVIREEAIDTVVICGMGGGLIRSILENGEGKLSSVKRLVLQPNMDSHYLRAWLDDQYFHITAEEILEEDGHIYEVIIADKKTTHQQMTDKQCYFGPLLMQEKNSAFLAKWRREQENISRIIEGLKKGKQIDQTKMDQFNQALQWTKEVLTNEDNSSNDY